MINFEELTIKKNISTLDSVVKSNENDTLGSALSRVRSSHDAVFIFNDNEEFLGLISPFKTLYSSNLPYTTKVSSIIFKPPTITEETPIYEVVEHMLSTKIYNLPVFGKKGVVKGVIYGEDIWRKIGEDPDLLEFVGSRIDSHVPITTEATATVKDVFHKLKEKGVSRMILVDAKGVLEGIVTRGDLMHSKMKPTSRIRFSGEGSSAGYSSLAGEKIYRKNESIRRYYTSSVDSLSVDTPMSEVVKHLINSPHNSIVLVDEGNKPVDFLSIRDIIETLLFLRPKKDVKVNIRRPGNSVSDEELRRATEHLESFGRRLKKQMEIDRIEVTSEEPKSSEGRTKVFNITVTVIPVAGQALIASTNQREFIDGIQEATKLIAKQHRRS